MKGLLEAVGVTFGVIFMFGILAKGGVILRADFNKIGATGHNMVQGALKGADEVPSSALEFRFDPSADPAANN